MLCGSPPFYSRDKNKMFQDRLEVQFIFCFQILKIIYQKPIPMKPYFSPEACSLLQGLLCLDVN
jgi:serine/threonine protein kinase